MYIAMYMCIYVYISLYIYIYIYMYIHTEVLQAPQARLGSGAGHGSSRVASHFYNKKYINT